MKISRIISQCIFALLISLANQTVVFAKEDIFLYRSPLTAAFFAQNGTDFDTLLLKWHAYLKSHQVGHFREVTRAQLLKGLPPGVLVLGSAIVLDQSERDAIGRYTQEGNGLIGTWGSGARDGKGQWAGYAFLEGLMGIKIDSLVKREDETWFLNLHGDSPLSFSQSAGRRFYLGKTAESPIRIKAKNLAASYLNWERDKGSEGPNGAISYSEIGNSRRVFMSFSESSWEYISSDELYPILDNMFDWLRHRPQVYKANWPNAYLSGHLIEMDTEDKYENSIHFAKDLQNTGVRGTFYSLTSISRKHPELVKELAKHHEIGYHGDVHIGFKGKTEEEQWRRLNNMAVQMKESVGESITSSISGFRAPTESYDKTTDKLLRKLGVKHHVIDPSGSEGRLPFFSDAEPEIDPELKVILLPRTQSDDLNFKARRYSNEITRNKMLDELDMVMRMGALGVLSVHSQNYGDGGSMAFATPDYLKKLSQNESHAWAVSGKEIAEWWRARNRVVLKPRIAGRQEMVAFTVKTPGNVKGLTLMVTNPTKDSPLKGIDSPQAGFPAHKVQAIDEFRSAIVFENLEAGDYRFNLRF